VKPWILLFAGFLLLPIVAFAGEGGGEVYAFTPREVGILILRELSVEGSIIRIRIDTGGCTTKDDIVARVEEKETKGGGIPHYEVTFVRETPDDCPVESLQGEILGYDLQEDLHLELPCTVSVTNPVIFLPSIEVVVEESEFPDANPETFALSLKKDLIAATVWAIETELKRYEESERQDRYEKIAFLSKELERFRKMSPGEYPLSALEKSTGEFPGDSGAVLPPEILEVEVASPPEGRGVLLEVVGMTRSGPFYHVAGIRGGDFSVFSPSTHYRLKLYLVYKREYFLAIPDYYVYIGEWEAR